MSAKVLIVDDLLPNIQVLEAKLQSRYYQVISLTDPTEAMETAKSQKPDIICLDVMMPKLNGFDLCKMLKTDRNTVHIPVIMVTALDDKNSKVQGLECGADDFLTKPVTDSALFTRLEILSRLKIMSDELRTKCDNKLHDAASIANFMTYVNNISDATVDIISDDIMQVSHISSALKGKFKSVRAHGTLKQFHSSAAAKKTDVIIVDMQLMEEDPLMVCSHLHNALETRPIPIIILVEDITTVHKPADMGIGDYINIPVDSSELLARLTSQIKRKRYQDALREDLDKDRQMLFLDALTACYNRRYLDSFLSTKIADINAARTGHCCLVMMDIDFFKKVNDEFGHVAGDAVLKQFADMVRTMVRDGDVLTRYGGEEFALLCNSHIDNANCVAERIRQHIECTAFELPTGTSHNKTVSIGVAEYKLDENMTSFIERADKALYSAKNSGRNKVVLDA